MVSLSFNDAVRERSWIEVWSLAWAGCLEG